MASANILVLNGPNLNLLGERDSSHYGSSTLKEINKKLEIESTKLDMTIDFFQSNHEGKIIDYLHAKRKLVDYAIINLGGYTHTSVAIRDALLAGSYQFVEVHISNIYKREDFRRKSLVSDIATGQIVGLGPSGYLLALNFIREELNKND